MNAPSPQRGRLASMRIMQAMRKRCIAIVFASASAVLGLGGCPAAPSEDLSAVITISATAGPAPLRVTVNATDSTAVGAEIVEFAWDFDGQVQSSAVSATHTFNEPGRYTIRLTVTDSLGRKASSSVEVQARGTSAVAIIQADRTQGPPPLVVKFDGTGSFSDDDEIRDYIWTFGDGEESRSAAPQHVFHSLGSFTVTLRIVTEGGLEAQTQTVVTVELAEGSLQFDGNQFISLPASLSSNEATLEFWAMAAAGGRLLGSGSTFFLDADASTGQVRLQVGGETVEAPFTPVTWVHVALTTSDDDGTRLFVDGVSIGAASSAVALPNSLRLGHGFGGNIAEVRVWDVARTASQIAALRARRLTGLETGLLGYWPLSGGSGQSLTNLVPSGAPGQRGATASAEASDPAWSTVGPPVQ